MQKKNKKIVKPKGPAASPLARPRAAQRRPIAPTVATASPVCAAAMPHGVARTAQRWCCSQLPAHTTTFTPPRHLTTSAKVYLFDEGSTISWVPCGKKLTCSFPGIKFAYGPDVYFDKEVSRQPIPSPDST